MVRKTVKRFLGLILAGGLLMPGCPISSDDVQQAAADSAESFVTNLFTNALGEFLNELFGLDS